MIDKPHSPACERNREPILALLREHFADRRRVLEIGSGTGQHALHFAAAMPWLTWQCSDRREYLPGIQAWLDEAALPNTPAAVELDVARPPWRLPPCPSAGDPASLPLPPAGEGRGEGTRIPARAATMQRADQRGATAYHADKARAALTPALSREREREPDGFDAGCDARAALTPALSRERERAPDGFDAGCDAVDALTPALSRERERAPGGFDAVFTANTLHIMSWREVEALFAGVDAVLVASGSSAPSAVVAVYGPFNYRGAFTSDSNAAFDAALKARNPAMGVRDFEAVDALARALGLRLLVDAPMPANNRLLVWRRETATNRSDRVRHA